MHSEFKASSKAGPPKSWAENPQFCLESLPSTAPKGIFLQNLGEGRGRAAAEIGDRAEKLQNKNTPVGSVKKIKYWQLAPWREGQPTSGDTPEHPRTSRTFQNIPVYPRTSQDIPGHPRPSQDISRHFRTSQNIP